MSRPKQPRSTHAVDSPEYGDSALRAELEDRMDQLRAVIEAKRAEGWTVVRAPVPPEDQTP